MNRMIEKIFFPNYYGYIDNICHNNLIFTTLDFKLVNEHQSFQLAYNILEFILRKPFSKNIWYVKSCRHGITRPRTRLSLKKCLLILICLVLSSWTMEILSIFLY